MIYLDNGATSLHKPAGVGQAMLEALRTCGNPGRGGYPAAMDAAAKVLTCRERAAALFHCQPEQVVFTGNCTHGLNLAINTLVKPGTKVVISGFEHNAVTRPLYARGAQMIVAGRKLFDPEDTLRQFAIALKNGAEVAVFTHCSNVFGYVLPVEEIGSLCRRYGVPFVVDAAQSAGCLPVDFDRWGAAFVAMPGHKGLLGPQGTGLLLCRQTPNPLLQGGTGSLSRQQQMPDFLPDGAEAGTLNVPGIAGLEAGLAYVQAVGEERIFQKEHRQTVRCVKGLEKLGMQVFYGENQSGTLSFVPKTDCEEMAQALAEQGISLRAGLHCAPLAHESAGTLETGTVRISFGYEASDAQTDRLLQAVAATLK